MSIIDRHSPIPAYFQIASDMRHRILKEEWKPGERLPTEANLAEYYGVSRMTMRQALAELDKDRLLKRQRGSGTFVNPDSAHIRPKLDLPINFSLRLREQGLSASAQLLQREVIPAPSSEIATSLNISEDEKVIYIKRVLLGSEQPIALNLSFLAYGLCPGIASVDLIEDSVSQTLARRFSLSPHHATHWLEAVRVNPDDVAILETDPDTPLLLLTTQSYLADHTPLEFSMTSWVGDRMRLSVEVVPFSL